MLWIISGPSSVGKSTFMQSRRFSDFVGGDHGQAKVVFGFDLAKNIEHIRDNDHEILFHYNIARILGKHVRKNIPFNSDDLPKDDVLDLIRRFDVQKKAIVLVVNKRVLLDRVNSRDAVEPLSQSAHKKYNSGLWHSVYQKTNLLLLYNSWCDNLETEHIPYTLLDSTTLEYETIESRDKLPRALL